MPYSIDCIFLFLVFTEYSYGVKLNMEGTLSLGRDVMNSLSQFLGNTYVSARRFMDPNIGVDEDTISDIVRSEMLCQNLDFCFQQKKFVEEYLTVLAKSVRTVLTDTLGDNFKDFVYESQLKNYLDNVRNILQKANERMSDDKELEYFWINTMKKICAQFQEMASIFVVEELQIDPIDLNSNKKELNQKLIIATALIELKYQTKLCKDHNICIGSYEATRSLKILLEKLDSLPEEKVRLFIRYLYEALFETSFYSHVEESIAQELQIVLNDLAYANEIPAKEILAMVQEIVDARLQTLQSKTDEKLPNDSLLMHAILSDLDHMYSLHKTEPFRDFIQQFLNWATSENAKFGKQIRFTLKNIGRELSDLSHDLSIKLIKEIKVFLELTIDAEESRR